MDRSLRLLTLGTAIRTFGAALYNPFLALFLYSVLHLGYLEITGLVVALGLIQLPFGVLGGLLADRIGHRRLIIAGLAIEAVTAAALGYSFALKSLDGAVLAALVGGSLISAAGPASAAYIADHASGSERTRAYTWYRVGFNAGFSAGVALGGGLVVLLGFSGAVYVGAAIIAVASAVVAIFLPPSATDRALREGRARVKTPTVSPARPSMGESLRRLSRDRAALEVALAFALGVLVVAQWQITFPLFVHNDLGINYALLGLGLSVNGLLVVFAQNWTTSRAIGHRHTSVGIVGVALYAVAFVVLGAAGLFMFAPVVVFFVAVAVLTEGENLASIPSSTLPSNLSPPGETGAYNGVFQAIIGAASLGALLLGGVVLTYVTDPLIFWAILSAPAVPAILLFRRAGTRISRIANTA